MSVEIVLSNKFTKDLRISMKNYFRIRTAVLQTLKTNAVPEKEGIDLLNAMNELTEQSEFIDKALK